MTNNITNTEILNHLYNKIVENYYSCDVDNIVKLLNTSTEDEFQELLLAIVKEKESYSNVLAVKYSKTEFYNDVFSGDNSFVCIVKRTNVRMYKLKNTEKTIEKHQVALIESLGIEVESYVEEVEQDGNITIFWTL